MIYIATVWIYKDGEIMLSHVHRAEAINPIEFRIKIEDTAKSEGLEAELGPIGISKMNEKGMFADV
jgi:hypothetical protein